MEAYISLIAKYLPENIEVNPDNRLTKKTGIKQRHITLEGELASDLAINACLNLFKQGVDKSKIDFILYCTQSTDYFLPSTACILQDRLNLNKNVGALDFNLGCSGYVYGLSMAKGLIETGQSSNVLLITSETYSKYIHPKDDTVKPLFGDGATATLITSCKEENSSGLEHFVFGTDGSGYDKLIVPVGGMRNPYRKIDIAEEQDEAGNIRTNANLYMNGAAISDFALKAVPDTVKEILNKANLDKEEIDYYVFHQANKFMLNFLQQKCDLQGLPFWNDVTNYGNTVSSSIPLALIDLVEQNKTKNFSKVMLIGFGVGLSWAGCIADLKYLKQ